MEGNKKQVPEAFRIIGATLSLVLLFMVAYTLSIMSSMDSRLAVIENHIPSIANEVSVVNRKLSDATQAWVSTPIEPAETSTPAEEAPSYTHEELTDMVISTNFDDLLAVASSPNATETQLLLVAQECVNVFTLGTNELITLVVALVDNPNCTTSVVTALANINYYEVWLVVAQSDLCSEATLLLLANHVAPQDSSIEPSALVPVVSAICENDAVSIYVLSVLQDNHYACIARIVQAKSVEITQPEINYKELNP